MSNVAETTPSHSSHPCPDPHLGAIRNILVCLDRSLVADGCLSYARIVAEAFGATMTLLHVMPTPPGAHGPNRADPLEWEIAKRESEHYLSQARTSLGIAAEKTLTRLIQGFPAEQIVATAREIGADLTVLSSRGDGTAAELGSVAQHVIGLARGSVLITPPTSCACAPPKRILVPLDGSLRSESVLPVVAELARFHSSDVLLVNVVAEPVSTALLSDPYDMRVALSLASRVEANARGYLARMRARLLPQVPAVKNLVVRRTELRQALLDVSVEEGADMLILTAHGSTCNAERAFGSVASFLLAHTHLPILVMQDLQLSRNPSAPTQPARGSLSSRPSPMERD